MNQTINYQAAYDKAASVASAALKASRFAHDTYGCGSSFVTIHYKVNPKFYNWAKKVGLLKRDGYYGAILDTTHGLRAVVDGYSAGTQAEEFYNTQFCKALDNELETGAFTHTLLN